MLTCPSCGQQNPEGFRFCGACAAPLTEEARAPREERKVVTVLFCDLVGSTARAERLDPEDVRALLSRYHERVRHELERFGGTVEKFIGDAVMALFGAPVAHEDDPERAVRAGLAIREWAGEDGELQIRIGVTTGEALVALGARQAAGEGMASGDVVNTAARLQSAAPVNGILVDETTHRATDRAIEYGKQRAVAAKGKAEAVSVWEALQARARVHVERGGRAPLVGRKKELEVLLAALRRVREDREPQLATLVGVPGIGKSRLVYELFKAIEVGGELTFWRQGRSPAYGEGVSFWALGEIVKAQAGVLETDDEAGAAAKLRETIATLVSDAADAQWLERHLRPLVGLEGADELGSDRRDEAFAAWRRFLEALAERRPLVLVFEDLHFADDGLLDFVDYLADWASGVPILVVATARPELLSRRPGWGGGKANAVTLSLAALSDEDTARLVRSLLERRVLSADVQETLLARAGGNPLYAEEFVRILAERRRPEELPETVQGLIAARIDALPSEEKALLQDASVVGKAFWLGAAAALAGTDRRADEERLHALERKEFVRRERRSSVTGEAEYAFRHLLVRDVAYGQIPRAARAEKHLRAAEWLDSLGRPPDHAELLAHHYLSALELLRAAGRHTGDVAEPARVALRDAGDRALALSAFAPAARYYGEALELWPPDGDDRPSLLLSLGRARFVLGHDAAELTLEEAREALLASEERAHAAVAEALLAEIWWFRGNRDRCDVYLERAHEHVAELPASHEKAHVLAQAARFHVIAGDNAGAIRIGGEALAIAESLQLAEVEAHALVSVGFAKGQAGDVAGIDDLERTLAIATAKRSPQAARAAHNHGATLWYLGDLRRGEPLLDDAIRIAEEFGYRSMARFSRGARIELLFLRGRWAEAMTLAEDAIAERATGDGHPQEHRFRRRRAFVRLARGDTERALDDLRVMLELAREIKDPQSLHPALSAGARIYADAGRIEEARALAAELVATFEDAPDWFLVDAAWVAGELGHAEELRRLFEEVPNRTAWGRAGLALLDGNYEAAAEAFDETGDMESEAAARLRAGEKLLAEGRRADADEQLAQAVAFFRSVGATRYIREAEALLSAPVESRSQ